jgi:hypothetical protein
MGMGLGSRVHFFCIWFPSSAWEPIISEALLRTLIAKGNGLRELVPDSPDKEKQELLILWRSQAELGNEK